MELGLGLMLEPQGARARECRTRLFLVLSLSLTRQNEGKLLKERVRAVRFGQGSGSGWKCGIVGLDKTPC